MTAIERVCELLEREMGLVGQNRVFLWDSKINLPSDDGLYLAVSVVTVKPFSNTNAPVSNQVGFQETQSANFLANVSVDLFSRGPFARDRKEEVVLALRSQLSQQMQARYGFYIAGITSSFLNLSEIDGAAIPYRFNISFNIQYFVVKAKQVEYYNDFTDTVNTEA